MEIQNPEMFIEGKMRSRKSAAQNLHNKILETPIWGKDLARNMAEKCRVKIEFSLGPSRHEILMDFAMPKLRSETLLFTHEVEPIWISQAAVWEDFPAKTWEIRVRTLLDQGQYHELREDLHGVTGQVISTPDRTRSSASEDHHLNH